MNESRFITSVNRYLRTWGTYAWKINDSFTSGIPDTFYAGDLGTLWIEYKYFKTTPRILKPKLTELQRKWLHEADLIHIHTAVVVGTPDKHWIYHHTSFEQPISKERLLEHGFSTKELAEHILQFVGKKVPWKSSS